MKPSLLVCAAAALFATVPLHAQSRNGGPPRNDLPQPYATTRERHVLKR